MPFLTEDIRPKNAGAFAMLDDQFLLGGWRTVADIAARDAITAERRSQGMHVFVRSDQILYQLLGGLLNANWAVAPGSGLWSTAANGGVNPSSASGVFISTGGADQIDNADATANFVISNGAGGPGTEEVIRALDSYGVGSSVVIGRVSAYTATSTARVRGVGATGSFLAGAASAINSGLAEVVCGATGSYYGGHFVVGRAHAGTNGTARIIVEGYFGPGAFAQGSVFAGSNVTSEIRVNGGGGFGQGSIGDPYGLTSAAATIFVHQNAVGGFAQGHISSTGGAIEARHIGGGARGWALNLGIIRAFQGGFASGRADGQTLGADGFGSFATGNATGGDILASAAGCQQFGVGTNALANSTQFGGGARILHGTGPSTTNGDAWFDGTNWFFRGGGATVQITP